jgi:hypothetical protein
MLGLEGHDPAAAACERRRMAADAAALRLRSRLACGRRDLPGAHAGGLDPAARQLARHDRRSLGRPQPRMGDAVAAPFFNFATLPNVQGEEAYWGIKLAAIESQRLGPEPKYEPIEMPVNSPVGFYTAASRAIFGFALIWQIWWLAGLGFVGALRRLRRLRLAGRARIPRPRRGGGPGRPRPPRGARGPARPAARAPRERPHERLPASRRRRDRAPRPRGPPPARPSRPWRRAAGRGRRPRHHRAGEQAHHRRLRLLDLPAQRHRDVLLLLRRLRGAAGHATAGGPGIRELVDMPGSAGRPGRCCCPAIPAASPSPRPTSATSSGPRSSCWSPACSAWSSSGSNCSSSSTWRAAASPAAQRLPLRLLRPGRAATACTSPWRAVAADHDGAGAGEGLPAGDRPPADLLQPVLARAGHRLDRRLHDRLSDGSHA